MTVAPVTLRPHSVGTTLWTTVDDTPVTGGRAGTAAAAPTGVHGSRGAASTARSHADAPRDLQLRVGSTALHTPTTTAMTSPPNNTFWGWVGARMWTPVPDRVWHADPSLTVRHRTGHADAVKRES